jgi:hypothetical protein
MPFVRKRPWLLVGLLGVLPLGASNAGASETISAFADAKQTARFDDEGRDVGVGIGTCNYGRDVDKMSPADCAVLGGLWHGRSLDSSMQGKERWHRRLAH